MKKITFFILLAMPFLGISQTKYTPVNQNRVLTSAFPFLNFTYDARSAALGDAGIAISPDGNSSFINPAKLPFLKDSLGVAINYTPYARALINDMNLYGFNAYKVKNNNAFGIKIKYFDAGKVEMRDDFGNYQGEFSSKEFSIAGSFSKRISEKNSMGISLKYIFSDLAGRQIINGFGSKPVDAIAGDIFFFHSGLGQFEKKSNWLNYGASISNIGGKISYGDYSKRNFQPTLLKVGIAQNFLFGREKERNAARNLLTFTIDANKLLVPTPAVRDAKNIVISGIDEEKISGIGTIFQSWATAPNGFGETLKEITFSFGAEVNFKKTLSLRGGYFTQNKTKGDQHYFTVGLGLQEKKFGFDFSYLIPTGSTSSPTILANTWRFSLLASLSKK